jgi:hypothetical protein
MIWAYNGYNLLPGFPKMVLEKLYPFNPDAAAFKNSKYYVFKVGLHILQILNRLNVRNIFLFKVRISI